MRDRSGRIWVAADGYLELFDPGTEAFVHDPSEVRQISAINRDRSGTIWICTRQGLIQLDPVTGATARFQHAPINSARDGLTMLDVMNEIRMFFRRERAVISLDEAPSINSRDRSLSPLARVEQIEMRDWVHASLARLSARDRTAIRLRDLDGLTLSETAGALDASESAAKSTHFRARHRLASALRATSRVGTEKGTLLRAA